MNFLDVRTVIFSQLVTNAVCTVVLASLWLQNRRRFAGTTRWLLNLAFQTTAVLLIVLRGRLPDWISMVGGSALVIAGALLGYVGLARFVGRRSPQIHNYLLLAVFVAVHAYFTVAQPNLAARTFNMSFGLLVICFQCAWLALRQAEPDLQRVTQGVGWVFVGFCLVSAVRIAAILANPPASNDFFQSGLYDTLLLVAYQILLILLTFSLTLMVNQRLLGELQTQEEKFATAFRSSPYALMLTRLSDGQIREVNEGFVTIAGYPAAEVIGKTTPALQLWAREADRLAVVDELAQGRRVRDREFQFRNKAGEFLTGLFSAEVIRIDGRPWVLSSISDATERKQTEEALRRRGRELNRAQRVAKVGSWVWHIQANQLEWSDQMFSIFGIAQNNFSGDLAEVMARAIHPDDRAEVERSNLSVIHDKQPVPLEYRVVWPDGTVRGVWAEAGELTLDDAGQPLTLTGIVQDITERKQAEEALRESEFLFKESQRVAHIGSYRTDFARGLWESSEVLDQIFGIDQHFPRTVPSWLDIVHPDDREMTGQYLSAEVILKRKPFDLEYRITRKSDGEVRWVHGLGKVDFDREGQILSMIGTIQDITERKQAEEALRFTQYAVDHAADPILWLAKDTGQVSYVNAAVCRLLGYAREELLSLTAFDIDPNVPPPEWLRNFEVLQNQGSIHFETAQRAKNGQMIPVEVTANYVEFGGQVYNCAFVRDITERKRMEADLRESEAALRQLNTELERRVEERTAQLNATNQELVHAIRAKDEFLAGMSHELRTPLTAILGLAESLQMKYAGPLTDKQLQYVQVIHQSGDHLLALINDVLDLAKVSAGRLELQLGPVSVDDLCRAAQHLITPQASKKQITVLLALDPAVTFLQADERRLKQILVNLLGNAVKFTPEGGQVGLTVSGDEIRRRVDFTVWDTGLGIAAEDLPRLFQDFVQLDARLAREYEGTGLGLAMVRRLVERHGGQVRAESKGPGQGSRFTVSLPWAPEATASKAMLDREPPPPPAERISGTGGADDLPVILVVDDQPALLLAVQGILTANHYQVETVEDSRSAVTRARALRPALMLVDVQMPHLDGLALIRQMRADAALAATPIIALTALAMPGDRERCLEAGASDYLSKPVNVNALLKTVQRLVEA